MRKQVSPPLPDKQSKPQSHRYANKRGMKQFSCVKERTVLQVKSWTKSQSPRKAPCPARSHLCSAPSAVWQRGAAAGAVLGKVIQVLVLARRGTGRYETLELQLQGGTGAPGMGRASSHIPVKETVLWLLQLQN